MLQQRTGTRTFNYYSQVTQGVQDNHHSPILSLSPACILNIHAIPHFHVVLQDPAAWLPDFLERQYRWQEACVRFSVWV